MKKLLLSLTVLMFLLVGIQNALAVDARIAKIITGTWTYGYWTQTNQIRGNLEFTGVIAGNIYDNKYGKGTFTGKFTNAHHFVGRVSFPSADVKHQAGKLYLNFFLSKSHPYGWSFKGGIHWDKQKYAEGETGLANGTKIK